MDHQADIRELGLGPDPASVRDVLVVRPGGLGELVKAVPALRHLRSLYSGARIGVVAERDSLELLAGCPYVDRLVDVERPAEALLERIDVAISFADPRTEFVLTGAGSLDTLDAVVRVAYRLPEDQPRYQVHPALPLRLAETERMLRLVWLLGGSQPESALSLWPTLVDRNAAARLLEDIDGPIVSVHVGARSGERRWPIERYVDVVTAIADLGLNPVLVGVESERALVDQLLGAVAVPVTDLVGRTTVGVLTGVLERSVLFIGNDSGPAVLAAALGMYSVVIGPTNSLEQLGGSGRGVYVTSGSCEICREHVCEHGLAAADQVSAEVVLGRVVLAASQARSRWLRQRVK